MDPGGWGVRVQPLCPQTTLVSVANREGDIYQLFQQAQEANTGVKLLVRADRARRRQVTIAEEHTDHHYLWVKLGEAEVQAKLEVYVPRRDKLPARHAKLEVRHAKVVLKPLKERASKRGLRPITMWAIYAKEVDAPREVAEPIDWMVLTDVPTQTSDEALERLRWYSLRWNIEIYHRTLKSGCKIEDRQLGDANSQPLPTVHLGCTGEPRETGSAQFTPAGCGGCTIRPGWLRRLPGAGGIAATGGDAIAAEQPPPASGAPTDRYL